MSTKQYYVNHTSCRVHNKKTQQLAELLKRYDKSMIAFDEEGGITPQTMLDRLENYLIGINQNYRGNNITVQMTNFSIISFVFIDKPDSGDSVASITLLPVKQVIDSEDQL